MSNHVSSCLLQTSSSKSIWIFSKKHLGCNAVLVSRLSDCRPTILLGLHYISNMFQVIFQKCLRSYVSEHIWAAASFLSMLNDLIMRTLQYFSQEAHQRCFCAKVFEYMKQFYRRLPMPKFDFNKVKNHVYYLCNIPLMRLN